VPVAAAQPLGFAEIINGLSVKKVIIVFYRLVSQQVTTASSRYHLFN
jgi:hypothetical protein